MKEMAEIRQGELIFPGVKAGRAMIRDQQLEARKIGKRTIITEKRFSNA
jgi:hypothetical protein